MAKAIFFIIGVIIASAFGIKTATTKTTMVPVFAKPNRRTRLSARSLLDCAGKCDISVTKRKDLSKVCVRFTPDPQLPCTCSVYSAKRLAIHTSHKLQYWCSAKFFWCKKMPNQPHCKPDGANRKNKGKGKRMKTKHKVQLMETLNPEGYPPFK